KIEPGKSFIQCVKCRRTLFLAEFIANSKVCTSCGHHHRLTWQERAELTFDDDSFELRDTGLRSQDPLHFPDYLEKHEAAQGKLGMADSAVSGVARLDGIQVATAICDFHFMGGSMGSVNGEKITRTLERGVEERMPVIIFCASG